MQLGSYHLEKAFRDGRWKAYQNSNRLALEDISIQCNSVNVTLSNMFRTVRAAPRSFKQRMTDWRNHGIPPWRNVIDPYNSRSVVSELFFVGEFLRLKPGDFILGSTQERFDTSEPLDIEPLGSLFFKQDIDGRSTMGRLGVGCHVTAGFGDYYFNGTWTLEIFNVSRNDVLLYPGMEGFQVYFVPVLGASRYQGAYQHQEGPRAPRLGIDRFRPSR